MKKRPSDIKPARKTKVGVVGLGLMGTSIATTLLVSGHPVVAIASIPSDLNTASTIFQSQLTQCQQLGLLNKPLNEYLENLLITENYAMLEDCRLVIECVIEEEKIKISVYNKIESVVSSKAIIGTNTSAIPIRQLQQHLKHPGRFLGLHWAEPAFSTRFLEVTCGDKTEIEYAEKLVAWAENWNKEPTLLRKDIRGFITNRLMYAVYREGLAQYEAGVADLDDLDKAFRYDVGSWISIMGLFERMDYIGVESFGEELAQLLPMLSNSKAVPEVMESIVDNNARGIHNQKGLYNYSPEEAKNWDQAFADFSREIFHLTEKYISDIENNDH